MIRVGFIIDFNTKGWLGGLNYYRSLLSVALGSTLIKPVVITPAPIPPDVLRDLNGIEIIFSDIAASSAKTKFIKLASLPLGRSVLTERFLAKHKIDVLSHSGHLGPLSKFPTIGWIPDFQHVRMPNFFSKREIISRDRSFRRLISYCTRVIVSSEDAQRDLLAFSKNSHQKVDVVRFVPNTQSYDPEPLSTISSRYSIPEQYFYVPNQFWVHKNHIVVIEALDILKRRGRSTFVACTGNQVDPRSPEHFEFLMRRAAELDVLDRFKVLGLVPYKDVKSLGYHATAIINPSRFEGWSTTVEEAKAEGKALVLSDIPVHREQAPPEGIYFDPGSALSLADAICRYEDSVGEKVGNNSGQIEAAYELSRRQFLGAFEQSVLAAVGRS